MRLMRFICATAVVLTVMALCSPWAVGVQAGRPAEAAALSPYWAPAVQRWEQIIVRYSAQRGLDPDLVAAVIWKESLGRPNAHSPAGAVGLMMLMPFSWRPSAEELENPWTNVAWGTRTLVQIIGDGDGDLYYALAAYNGSWEKVDQSNTRRYAAAVLDHYTRAIAVRHGLAADGDWTAIIAVQGLPAAGTVTVLGPQRPLARYTARPWQADVPTVPEGVLPCATAVTYVDELGTVCQVDVWLVAADGSQLICVPDGAPAADDSQMGGAAALGRPQEIHLLQ